MSSTKLIYATNFEDGQGLGTWHGNIISADGLILTVAHAIIDAQSKAHRVIFHVADRPGVMAYKAELITPPDRLRCRPDLAILRIVSADQLQTFAYCALARAFTLVRLTPHAAAPSSSLPAGESVCSRQTGVAFTEGYTDICQRYHESAGRVYAARGLVKSDELALTFGDSGKPLFNHLGQLVAIASYTPGLATTPSYWALAEGLTEQHFGAVPPPITLPLPVPSLRDLAKIAFESQLIQQAEDLRPSAPAFTGASPLTSRPSEPTVWEQVIAEVEPVDDLYQDEEVEDEDDEEGATATKRQKH